jgi:hypothetical protein
VEDFVHSICTVFISTLFYNARALELKPVTSFILRETAQVEKIRKRKREKKSY